MRRYKSTRGASQEFNNHYKN